jgi:hypothetical protein
VWHNPARGMRRLCLKARGELLLEPLHCRGWTRRRQRHAIWALLLGAMERLIRAGKIPINNPRARPRPVISCVVTVEPRS